MNDLKKQEYGTAEEDDLPVCDHEGTGRVQKYDGGRCPLLCAECYEIVGTWRPE